VEPDHDQIPVTRQCELLGLCRSSYYYQPATETPLNLELIRIMDEQYLKMPFHGVPRMTPLLRNMGYPVNHKRVERLMRVMGLQAIYPKKNLSTPDAGHLKFPYLLRGLHITRPDQVWATDITYIRMQEGIPKQAISATRPMEMHSGNKPMHTINCLTYSSLQMN
jgi:putative transposase